jgi:hypothetical protein
MEIKKVIIIAIASAIISGLLVYFSTPTKIETKIETRVQEKVVNQKVYVDREITKIVKPDGTIEEKTIEKDRSIIDRRERIDEEIKSITLTNPKYLSLGFMYKVDIIDIQNNILNPYDSIGVWAVYDTGILNSEIMGGIFYDRTVILGLGVKL